VDIIIYAVLIISTATELMKLIFAVLDVSLTMDLTRCYKPEGFLHLYLLFLYMFYAIFIRYTRLRWRKSKFAHRLLTSISIIAVYSYLSSKLILVLMFTVSRSLSRHWYCSYGAPKSKLSQWLMWINTNCPLLDSSRMHWNRICYQ